MREQLERALSEKLVSVQKHPETDLFIYNYSPRVQFDKLWDDTTRACRGLILDGQMNVVAKPFGKFFNIEEHTPEEIPSLPFDVFEKLDGSLGILYWHNGIPKIATRGSFTSEQAIHATELLHKKYSHLFDKLNPLWTYLFEIIYPSNRIVVDYGDVDDLFLLTVIHNDTGKEALPEIGFPVVKRFDGINDISKLKELQEDNKEGFVIRFSNGFRVKVKFEEYVRLHRIITGVSNVVIWEYLKDGKPLDALLDKVPDEFYEYVRSTANQLQKEFIHMEYEANDMFDLYYHEDKKTFALNILKQTPDISAILFNMYNKKNHKPIIWKKIRPTYQKPFKQEA